MRGHAANPDADLIASLGRQVHATVAPLLAGARRVALLDFPNQPNVGDSAIWLGDLACLKAVGIQRTVYTCEVGTYSRKHLAAEVGDGIIVFHGGGNFGDVWPNFQVFRERVVADFPHNRIVMFPQTIHFGSATALARARAAINGHGGVTILARDQRSLEIAGQAFTSSVALCPDTAFCLGPLARPAAARQPVLALARTDIEAVADTRRGGAPGIATVDWLEDEWSVFPHLPRPILGALLLYPRRLRALRRTLGAVYRGLARRRVERGCRLLSRGKVVVTDRLHGHILCMLLGIPHFLVDNSYGKLSGFHRTWTPSSKLAGWCASWPEALARASVTAAGTAEGGDGSLA